MMAKTDWQMGDTVLPDDLNQIGQEINQNRDNLAAHANLTSGVHGATSAATPNTLVQRDANERFKAAAPAASDDVARKAEVDGKVSKSGDTMTGNLTLPRIRLTVTSDASETSTNHAFQIGPDNGENIRIDTNEIIFVNNGVFGQGYIGGSRVDLANSVRGNDGGNAQAKMGNTWYDIWHKGNLLESEITHQIATNTYKESDSITAWPRGLSYMRVEWAGSDANLWLGNVGSVLTLRCTTQTGFQFFIPTVNYDLFYIRTTVNGVWQPWRVVGDYCGNGSPEGNVTAIVGSIYRRLDGSSGSTIYVKRSGYGNTGWYALA